MTHWLVESDNGCDSPPPEVVTVVVWDKRLEAIVDTSNVGWTRKRQQLPCIHLQNLSKEGFPQEQSVEHLFPGLAADSFWFLLIAHTANWVLAHISHCQLGSIKLSLAAQWPGEQEDVVDPVEQIPSNSGCLRTSQFANAASNIPVNPAVRCSVQQNVN